MDILKLDDDEYEAKETEQPRAMEFHTSSSSESESDEEQQGNGHASRFQSSAFANFDRPKTAAKELEQYRHAVPEEFFKQIDNDTADDDYELEKDDRAHTDLNDSQDIETTDNTYEDGGQSEKASVYKVHVPVDIQELFSVSCEQIVCIHFIS